MLSNKNGIDVFYTAFKEACGGQDVVFLDHTKFQYAIQLLAQTIFHNEDPPMEAMFSQLLTDSIMTTDSRCKKNYPLQFYDVVVGGRVPRGDEETLKILSEEALIVYLNYLDQLKKLYTQFVH
jgi:hypothetical protein